MDSHDGAKAECCGQYCARCAYCQASLAEQRQEFMECEHCGITRTKLLEGPTSPGIIGQLGGLHQRVEELERRTAPPFIPQFQEPQPIGDVHGTKSSSGGATRP